MRALITGINGFTGRYMADELRRAGYEVFGTGNHASSDLPGYFCADLLDTESIEQCIGEVQPDVVVHLAAIAFVAHGAPEQFYQVNLIGTRNLLAALSRQSKLPVSVLLASSANIYGNGAEGMLTEATPPNPANDYAVSKLSMEYMARLWLDKLPIVLTRPFNYTGIGQAENFLLPKIVGHFRRRAEAIELGNLDVWRDFSDVRAVVAAYRRLLEARPIGAVFNVCSGLTYSLREVLAMAQDITGHAPKVTVNPDFVRANEVRTLCGDASRLKGVIGDWQPPPLQETLRWMLTAQ
jgi:GDP-6-deoxy-D-talose 4-dehydrogenase